MVADITRDKGVAGLWDGFFPWGTVQALLKGAVFGVAHAVAIRHLAPLAATGLLSEEAAAVLSGGLGGALQGVVLSPLLLLKTRVMTDPSCVCWRAPGGLYCAGRAVLCRVSAFSKQMQRRSRRGCMVFDAAAVCTCLVRWYAAAA